MYLIAAFYVARLRINIVTNHQDDDRINKFRIFLEEANAELFSITFAEKRDEASREYQLQYQHQSMMLNYYTVFNAKTNYKENDNKMKYFYRRQRLFADRRVVYVSRIAGHAGSPADLHIRRNLLLKQRPLRHVREIQSLLSLKEASRRFSDHKKSTAHLSNKMYLN